jgi:flagellin-like hook-associated protein FlgL
MAIGDISLSTSARTNLLALQSSAKLLDTTQGRLSSGKKVNSALDNASSYFQSQGFLGRANDLSGIKDGLSTALQTVKAAVDAISSITKVVDQLKGLVASARQTSDSTTLGTYYTQYTSLSSRLTDLANDATFNGKNLINSSTNNSFVVRFDVQKNGGSTISALTITGVDRTAGGLDVDIGTGGSVKNGGNDVTDFTTAGNLDAAESYLSTALNTLRSDASTFGNNNTLIQTRVDFTASLISSLQSASDNLILADINEEGANLQALQARQQLGIVALGISGQSAQAILRLF